MYKDKFDSSDVFLSYADDVFENHINVDLFKAVVNLYALISDRITIADSFFINNRIVRDFFVDTADGFKYIDCGIIVPLLRNSVNNFNDLYFQMCERKTIKEQLDRDYIEKIDESTNKNIFKWNEKTISKNFTYNVLSFFGNEINFGRLKLNGERKKILNDIENVMKNDVLYRIDIINTIKRNNRVSQNLKNEIIDIIDILYNYNIPEYYGLMVAYPDFITENNKLIKEIFFREQQINSKHDLIKSQYNEINTLIFDYGLLSNLSVDQIVEIRKTSEYKNYISAIRNLNTKYKYEDYVNLFAKYNDKINVLIPQLIDKEKYQDILKREKKLTINEKIFEYSNDIINITLGLLINDLSFTIASTLFLKGLSIAFKKYQSKQREAIEKLKSNNANKLTEIKSGINIFDKLNKDFKLNISEGKMRKEGS
ncbi:MULTISPECIES: hypothetical protein [Thermoanaerobacterium]|uniref:Uncharacterized protein n=2 Tax=Thermoanaerobacterium TaxID=28895 RepID=W9E8X2_9THEO|nr:MULTISPECIES: hypothetical protein [Thermoanaerobacterium]AFK85626.1 hypothetical protein Tsac_0600 [Thermoanaerobacterium saccharolyticum JW/SL-YS485]ETO37441.1 hypothetical protein V518_2403 [Thermoanaerobacterium aotearoense SCUT27]